MDTGEAPLTGAPIRSAIEEFGSCQCDDEDRVVPRPFEERLDEINGPVVRRLQVLKHHDARLLGAEMLEEGTPGGEQLVALHAGLAYPEQGAEGLADPLPVIFGYQLFDGAGEVGEGHVVRVVLENAGPPTHHLPKRPEGHALAVGGRPALMPEEGVCQTVEMLLELPNQAALADTRHALNRDEVSPPIPHGGLEQVTEKLELCDPADEGRLQASGPACASTHSHHIEGPPHGDTLGLTLQLELALVLVDDCVVRGMAGGLVDQHGPRFGRGLQAGGSIDQVTGHHAMIPVLEGDRCLPRGDAGSHLQFRNAELASERGHVCDQVEGRAHCPFGVVFEGSRRAPDGHHAVAQELVDGAAVAVDGLRGQLGVASEEVADLLGVAALRGRGEAHEIGEKD